MIFDDNCFLFAEDKTQMLKMIGDATENLKKRGLKMRWRRSHGGMMETLEI